MHRKGNIRINELKEYTKYSERTINYTFTHYYGFSPKTFCLILRFQNALQQLTKVSIHSLTELAQELGYADQSHFIREFKRFNLLSPKKSSQTIAQQCYQNHIVYIDQIMQHKNIQN